MLQQVLEHIHNMFIKAPNPGTYTIRDGNLPVSFLDGQRIWIVGSVLNDGVYTYHESGLTNDDDEEAAGLRDETFTGSVCALAVPPAVIALTGEIKAWVEQYGENMNSPYHSENVIGVYSYEKEMFGGSGNATSKPASWEDIFASRLNRWRKVSF